MDGKKILDDIEIKMTWETFKEAQKENSKRIAKMIKLAVEKIKYWCDGASANNWCDMYTAVEQMRKMGIQDIGIEYPKAGSKTQGEITMCINKKEEEDWWITTMWEEDLYTVSKAWLGVVNKTEYKENYDVETYVRPVNVDEELTTAIQETLKEAHFDDMNFLADHEPLKPY